MGDRESQSVTPTLPPRAMVLVSLIFLRTRQGWRETGTIPMLALACEMIAIGEVFYLNLRREGYSSLPFMGMWGRGQEQGYGGGCHVEPLPQSRCHLVHCLVPGLVRQSHWGQRCDEGPSLPESLGPSPPESVQLGKWGTWRTRLSHPRVHRLRNLAVCIWNPDFALTCCEQKSGAVWRTGNVSHLTFQSQEVEVHLDCRH